MKKVAIVGQTLNKNFAKKISGGIQTVERLHVDIFLDQGWEVFFISPSDSEQFRDHHNFKLCLLKTPSEEAYKDITLTKHEKGSLNKSKSVEINEEILVISPDLIINHSFSSSHVRLMGELSKRYPVLNFVHNTPDSAMDIAYIAKLQHYLKIVKNGSNLVCVSGYQRDLWRVALNKRLDSESEHFNFISRSEIDQVYDPYCFPVYVQQTEMSKEITDRFIVITRPDPIKNLHKLLDLMTKCKLMFPLDIFIAHPSSLSTNEYYSSKIEPLITELRSKNWDINLYHNSSRDDLLLRLSKSKGCFIPCPVEAAPVALLEAGSYGVKSIVFAKKRDGVLGHAAADLLGSDNILLVDVSSSVEESINTLQKSIETIKNDDENREKLYLYTQKTHSFLQRTLDIMKIVNETMSRYKKPKPNLIVF